MIRDISGIDSEGEFMVYVGLQFWRGKLHVLDTLSKQKCREFKKLKDFAC